MRVSVVRSLVLFCAVLVLPALVYGQEAISGTVTDSTGAVLPGVTVTATLEATGNTFVAVTDERGAYRVPVRNGVFRVTAELSGFSIVSQTGVEVLVGQQPVLNLRLQVSTIQETVTVTGEAPLINTVASDIGANLNPQQLQELPVNGRNWLDLTLLTPGSRQNFVAEDPGSNQGYITNYQINVDGQQVTQTTGPGFAEPRFSRDAIAEFEVITNRFDATQGRSAGVQVNAVTKSGTNQYQGSLSGYFRSDKFNSEDFIQHRVLPYSDQQVSGTFGGPIRKDRIHFFGNYEYERSPTTFSYSTPYPTFNFDQTGTFRQKLFGARVDAQLSPQTRMTLRGSKFLYFLPYDPRYTGGSNKTPSSAESQDRHSNQLLFAYTRVLGNSGVNELRIGTNGIQWTTAAYVKWPANPRGANVPNSPLLTLKGLQIGVTHTTTPQHNGQDDYSIRDDYTYTYNKGGRHTMKTGLEYLYQVHFIDSYHPTAGTYDMQGGNIPANIEAIIPNVMDVSTWNLNALNAITRTYQVGVGAYDKQMPRHVFAGWAQDDWMIGPRLTLNLGLRYDLGTQIYGESIAVKPWLEADRPQDRNNVSPRLGFAYSLNDKTVVRGGWGMFYAEISDQAYLFTLTPNVEATVQVANDGRADFNTNPFNGPAPTLQQFLARSCFNNGRAPGCLRQAINSAMASPGAVLPYTFQTSIGMQRQIGTTMSFQADYVYNATRKSLYNMNVNLTYNPATGANYPYTDLTHLVNPDFVGVTEGLPIQDLNYHALQTSFNKRLTNRWQAAASYTLAGSWDRVPVPYSGLIPAPVTFPVAIDVGGEYGFASDDQRHRATFNGIYDAGYGIQLSGLYFYGSGQRFATTYGGDPRNTGGSGGRLRPDGTIVPRNSFVGSPIHRVDVRVQKRFMLGGRRSIDGLAEVYNLFNHENYGSYSTQESVTATYGKPTDNTNQAFQSRRAQFGFRFAF